MNKKQFSRVKSLYKDGVSQIVCITSIIEMSKSHTEAAVFIAKFFEDCVVFKMKMELMNTRMELASWAEVEQRMMDTNYKEKEKDEFSG